ncbi:MAG: nitrogen fixation protein NifM [Psychromonas sp.]|nr:nitrogen fixation protein NifM [Psychromonas sp.]
MLANYQRDTPVNLQYQIIKLAWSNYQSAPEALDSETLKKVDRQARAAQQIMTAVLGSSAAQNEDVKAQEVEFIFEQLQEQFDSPESFALSLKQQALTEQQLQLAIYQDLLCEKTIDSQSQNYPEATEQEALDYYQKNKDRFVQPERRKVSHILITINDEYPENRRPQALMRINGISKQLRRDPDKFSELAMKYSECPTSLNKGLIGSISRGQLYPELDEVLFMMQPQTISLVIESEIGFHLLFCHEISPAGEISQEDALQEICKQLNQHRKKKSEKLWLSRLLKA